MFEEEFSLAFRLGEKPFGISILTPTLFASLFLVTRLFMFFGLSLRRISNRIDSGALEFGASLCNLNSVECFGFLLLELRRCSCSDSADAEILNLPSVFERPAETFRRV